MERVGVWLPFPHTGLFFPDTLIITGHCFLKEGGIGE